MSDPPKSDKALTINLTRRKRIHMRKVWIQTLENRKLDPLALTFEMVGSIAEIAHSLAGEYRFTRQTKARYSVAQHCVEGSRLIGGAFALPFLLHELSEVYLPDIAGPLKPFVRIEREGDPEGRTGSAIEFIEWATLEREHTHVMLEALGLSSIEPMIYCPEVKKMDLAMLAAEKRDLMGPEPEPWGLPVEAVTERIIPVSSDAAAKAFVDRFWELTICR